MGFTKITKTQRNGYVDFYVFYSKDGKKLYYKTNVKVDDKHITKKGEISTAHPGFAFDQKALKKEQNRLEIIIQEFYDLYKEKPEVDYVLSKIKEPIKEVRQIRDSSVIDYLEAWMDYKRKVCGSPSSIKTYNNVKTAIEQYSTTRNKKLDFTTFTETFFQDFANFLLHEIKDMTRVKKVRQGNNNNTVSNRLKHLLEFCRWCKNEKDIKLDIDKIGYWIKNLKKVAGIKTYRPDKLVMTSEEINLLYTYDEIEADSLLEKTKLLFVFSCLNGARISDNNEMEKYMVMGDKFKKNARKTGTPFKIDLDEVSLAILKKYNFNLFMSDVVYNRYLKLVLDKFFNWYKPIFEKKYKKEYQMEFYKVSEKGKEKVVTTHTKAEMFASHNARATSITLDAENNIPLHKIMKKHAHKDLKTAMHYIHTSNIDYDLGSRE
jgi:hypothetical protein